jgi:hypothetical protein
VEDPMGVASTGVSEGRVVGGAEETSCADNVSACSQLCKSPPVSESLQCGLKLADEDQVMCGGHSDRFGKPININ